MSDYPHTCCCGAAAYIGLNAHECTNYECDHYHAAAPLEDVEQLKDAPSLRRGLEDWLPTEGQTPFFGIDRESKGLSKRYHQHSELTPYTIQKGIECALTHTDLYAPIQPEIVPGDFIEEMKLAQEANKSLVFLKDGTRMYTVVYTKRPSIVLAQYRDGYETKHRCTHYRLYGSNSYASYDFYVEEGANIVD